MAQTLVYVPAITPGWSSAPLPTPALIRRKQLPVQRMLDFDYLCGRTTPSVACIVQPGSGGFQKLFFGAPLVC